MCGKSINRSWDRGRTRREVILDTIRNYAGEATIGDLQFAVDKYATHVKAGAFSNVPAPSVRRDIQTLRLEGWNIRMRRLGTYITYELAGV